MHFILALLLGLYYFVSPACAEPMSSGLPYYADIQNPAQTTDRDPPYEHTRKQMQAQDYYLHVRYPYRRAKPVAGAPDPQALYFRITVGNERIDDIQFQVRKAELKYQGKALELIPIFRIEETLETSKDFKKLYKTWIRATPSNFGEVAFFCTALTGEEPEIDLTLDVAIRAGGRKEEHLKTHSKLFRGLYQLKSAAATVTNSKSISK